MAHRALGESSPIKRLAWRSCQRAAPLAAPGMAATWDLPRLVPPSRSPALTHPPTCPPFVRHASNDRVHRWLL